MPKKAKLMKIWKTLVRVEGSAILAVDTIEYKGKLWLVPEWTVEHATGTRRPTRLIGLRFGLPLMKPGPNSAHLQLAISLNKDTLAGRTARGFDVIEAPDVRWRHAA